MFTDVRVQKLKFKTHTFSGSSKVYCIFEEFTEPFRKCLCKVKKKVNLTL